MSVLHRLPPCVIAPRQSTWRSTFALLALACLALLALPAKPAAAAEVVESFVARYTIGPGGTVTVVEDIAYDFGVAQRHGIFRYFYHRLACPTDAETAEAVAGGIEQPTYPCPDGYDRQYDYAIQSVTDFSGRPHTFDVSKDGRITTIKIGDAAKFVTGRQQYQIRYTVTGMLDAYPTHDELRWLAARGFESAAITAATIQVVGLPAGATLGCAQGLHGTGTRCQASFEGGAAVFRSARPLFPNEEISIGASWDSGVVPFAPPKFYNRPSPDDYYEFDALEFGGIAATGVLGLLGLIAFYWRNGRDRRYKTLYYLTNDTGEGPKPLFARHDVVVEFLPPEGWRPAQMGVVLDESADTIDVTATIVDLAVRGYVTITEVDGKKDDWDLTRIEPWPADDPLLPYEESLLRALLPADEQTVRVSALKRKFSDDLARIQKQLYADAVKRKWFSRNPRHQVVLALVAGIVVIVLGVLASLALGFVAGRALMGVPIVVTGLLLLALSPLMAKRTATGSEALRRVLGFRLYIATAEKRPQEFNEQQNIFARYLPYAMVFGCVEKWAKAFEGLDDAALTASTGSWYYGAAAFNAATFSRGMNSFASNLNSTLGAPPPSSGRSGSGFSGGGFSGGGGGGGGGGSW